MSAPPEEKGRWLRLPCPTIYTQLIAVHLRLLVIPRRFLCPNLYWRVVIYYPSSLDSTAPPIEVCMRIYNSGHKNVKQHNFHCYFNPEQSSILFAAKQARKSYYFPTPRPARTEAILSSKKQSARNIYNQQKAQYRENYSLSHTFQSGAKIRKCSNSLSNAGAV